MDVQHRLFLRKGREASVLAHHPWLFSGAVERVESLPEAQDGDLCDLMGEGGQWLARGTLHRSSQIICRILTWEDEPIDVDFFRRRIGTAHSLRREMVDQSDTDSYRIVNAEGDLLPGLIVDRYANVLVVQCLTSGMARLEPLWCEALEGLVHPDAIIDRTDRTTHDPALTGRRVALRGAMPEGPIWIRENGLRFRLHVSVGQKTGFYLDQRENRALVARLAKDRETLNGFAYTGAFGTYAGKGGGAKVIQVESSAWALDEARTHWNENQLDQTRVEFVQADMFRYLRETDRTFDLIILDPPPYAKDRGSVDRAARAYKDVNLWAMRRLRPGGYILTFSCSQHVDVDLFQKIVFGAAVDAGASCQWLRRLGPGPDHPVHLDHPQGEYLKGFLLRLVGNHTRIERMSHGGQAAAPRPRGSRPTRAGRRIERG